MTVLTGLTGLTDQTEMTEQIGMTEMIGILEIDETETEVTETEGIATEPTLTETESAREILIATGTDPVPTVDTDNIMFMAVNLQHVCPNTVYCDCNEGIAGLPIPDGHLRHEYGGFDTH